MSSPFNQQTTNIPARAGLLSKAPAVASAPTHLPAHAAAALLRAAASRGADPGAAAAGTACSTGHPARRLAPAVGAQGGATRVHACTGVGA